MFIGGIFNLYCTVTYINILPFIFRHKDIENGSITKEPKYIEGNVRVNLRVGVGWQTELKLQDGAEILN